VHFAFVDKISGGGTIGAIIGQVVATSVLCIHEIQYSL